MRLMSTPLDGGDAPMRHGGWSWTGPMTVMLGAPEQVQTRVHKQIRAEVWKYQSIAANRYALRIAFENGVCVGWQTS